jgi:hypothetical protein
MQRFIHTRHDDMQGFEISFMMLPPNSVYGDRRQFTSRWNEREKLMHNATCAKVIRRDEESIDTSPFFSVNSLVWNRWITFFTESKLKMKIRKIMRLAVLLTMIPMLSGCWLLAAAGVGAYGGYKMKEDGYTLQNPVTKEKGSASQSK